MRTVMALETKIYKFIDMTNNLRKTIKIILLFFCMCFAVVAVMIYMKTRIQPPKSIQYVNQYVNNINRASSSLSVVSDNDLELTYALVNNRISLFRSENLIEENEKIECTRTFSTSYVNVFRTWCEKKFTASVWIDADHSFMRKRIADLRTINNLENVDKLQEVEKVLNDYRSAWRLGSSTVTSSSDSRNRMAKGRQYQNDNYLSHSTKLMEYLDKLPLKLYQSHRTYISYKVNRLFCGNYDISQIAQWGEDYRDAQSLVNDFNNNVNALYGESQEDFGLNDQFMAAQYYFDYMINEMSRFDSNYSVALRDYINVF